MLLLILTTKIVTGTIAVRRVLLSELNKYDLFLICNGCKPAWLDKYIPKKLRKVLEPIWNLDFILACNQHDVDYFFYKTLKEKKKADKDFYKAMKLAIKKQGHTVFTRWYYYYKAWQYYRLVVRFGKSAFLQNNADILPSYSPFLDKKIRKSGIGCVWVKERWYTRSEALELNLI